MISSYGNYPIANAGLSSLVLILLGENQFIVLPK
jgi:hypothetical protein